ncbi:MAG: hypothetical protein AAB214_20755 [Fibrobacterota bacterium]
MITLLAITAAASLAALALVGLAIGVFYQRKFGEGTQGWLLAVGAGLGLMGQILSHLPGLHPLVGDMSSLAGAVFLAVGTFWLWFVMMGPRQ